MKKPRSFLRGLVRCGEVRPQANTPAVSCIFAETMPR